MKINREYVMNLRHTKEYIAYIEQQIPALIDESVKRIKYMPFDDGESLYVACRPSGTSSTLLVHLAQLSGKVFHPICLPSFPNKNFFDGTKLRTQINGTRRDKNPDAVINIRGNLKHISHMPLYLEDGAYNQQYVYPIFDWSELQLLVATMMINEDIVDISRIPNISPPQENVG